MAEKWWPGLRRTKIGGIEDLRGIDGYLDGASVQVKDNRPFGRMGVLYQETLEKTAGKPWQEWRDSPRSVDWYIFCHDDYVVRVSSEALKAHVRDREPTELKSKTSIGHCIPLRRVIDSPECQVIVWCPDCGVPIDFETTPIHYYGKMCSPRQEKPKTKPLTLGL